MSKDTKLRIHNALFESIFLYNCEVWTTTKKNEQEMDLKKKKSIKKNAQYKIVRQSLTQRSI